MGMNIRCYTLFNITKTNIVNRKPPIDLQESAAAWQNKRNMQCNFDTIVQVISLRAQPENLSDPVQSTVKLKEFKQFGSLYTEKNPVKIWQFDFYVNHSGVFAEEDNKLSALYTDCDGVPMIKIQDEYSKLPMFLSTDPELINIYFEVLPNE